LYLLVNLVPVYRRAGHKHALDNALSRPAAKKAPRRLRPAPAAPAVLASWVCPVYLSCTGCAWLIERKINNGVKALLEGLEFPELLDEVSRLRTRRNELQNIITAKSGNQCSVSREAIIELFKRGASQLDVNPRAAIETLVNKIYAETDGSFTVNVGVHFTGSPGRIRTYDPPVNSRMLYR
jgi:hypothetical protein